MKDIYSPLEIDEEWDQRAPDAGIAEGGGTAVAVEPSPTLTPATVTEETTEINPSTLPQDEVGKQGSLDTGAPVAGETIEPNAGGAGEVYGPPTPAVEGNEQNPVEDTLNIVDMNSNNPETPTTVDIEDGAQKDGNLGEGVEGNDTDPDPDSTQINVMGDSSIGGPVVEGPEAGSVIEPQVRPDGAEDDTTEPEKFKPEVVEDEEPELPPSPVAEEAEPSEEPTAEVSEDAPELKTFKDRLEQQRQANIEAALKIKERAKEMRGREQSKADEAMANVEDADREIAEIEDELTALGYKEAA